MQDETIFCGARWPRFDTARVVAARATHIGAAEHRSPAIRLVGVCRSSPCLLDKCAVAQKKNDAQLSSGAVA